jgi:ADP-ribose pyrophosphatase YjhB (NUDIX family)
MSDVHRFVNVGETTEDAVLREAEEETGIVIPPDQANSAMSLIGVYSDPRRDNRRHIVSIAYALEFIPSTMITKNGDNVPNAGDDAKEVILVPLDEIGVKYKDEDWFDDHLTILLDFKERIAYDVSIDRKGELHPDVARSTCSSVS